MSDLEASRPDSSKGDDAERPDTSYEDFSPIFTRTVGPKVTNARLLKDKVGDGCPICISRNEPDEKYDTIG